jgi:RimJ/RimL family protein N-acetyltransferase
MQTSEAQALIRRLKAEPHLAAQQPRLAVVAPGGERITMRPLTGDAAAVSARDVALLTAWRNRNREYFLTDFTATEAGTRRWIVDVTGPDLSRILFMLDDADGTPFGHVGLCAIAPSAAYAELDNIVRGEGGPKGAMLVATQALGDWAREALGVRRMAVRVMADNPAVTFYERLGYRFVEDRPLTRVQEADDFVRWIEGSGGAAGAPATTPAERYLRYMEQPA